MSLSSHHILLIIVAVLGGYALGRYFPQIGQKVGLP